MRQQIRPAEPAEFVENSEKWNAQWKELRERNSSAQFQWYKVEGRPARLWALPSLRGMNLGHCSFCDAFPVSDRQIESVEHFKPKSRPEFYGEAYTWGNLYYACNHCQAFKNEQWDDRLLRPDDPSYAFLRYFEFDYTTGAIRPSVCASEEDKKRAEVTIRMYGLDEQTKRRYRIREARIFCKEGDVDDFAYRDYVEGA